ncbi:unnamed protein product, partial [Adineta steineri]
QQTEKKSNSNKTELISDRSTCEIKINLELFRIIIETDLLDIQFQGFIINYSQLPRTNTIKLILNDIYLSDLNARQRYHNFFIRQNHEIEILGFDLTTYIYSAKRKKKLDETDFDINMNLNKINIILLYKYMDLFLNIYNICQMNGLSGETNTNSYDILQNFKIRFDI